ncbi:MAG TPA: beta-propeller domain-containing protein [Myxococcota bacterium]|nr:beta-propeller domain-containing protein [Myxococcota bacterium]HQK51714.1 beta-propeller domain-containing protein [Myxococcota bacterium]
MNRTRWLTILWLVAAGVGGCTQSSPGADPTEVLSLDWSRSAALTAASDCDEAENWIEEAVITQMRLGVEANRRCVLTPDDCGWYRGGVAEDGATGGAPPPEANGPKDDQTPDEYSETNTQVEGVDEADRVKTDGEYLYVLSDRDLVVVRSWPAAQTQEVARVRLAVWPTNFFLDGDRAIVIGSANLHEVVRDVPRRSTGGDRPKPEPATDGAASDGGSAATDEDTGMEEPEGWYEYRPVTTVTVIDLANRTTPRIVREYYFEGYAMDSRRIADKVYLAQNIYQGIYDLEYWPQDLTWYGPDGQATNPSPEEVNAAFDALIERNIEKIRARTLEEWLPRYWTATGPGVATYAEGRTIGECTDVHAPSVFSGQALLSLVSLDVGSGAIAGSTIEGSWGTVYASLDAVYVGSTNWDFYWWWRGSDEEIPPIQTHIHKFAFDASGNARYRASGKVLGYAINQFAFDEYEGALRVATTDGFGWWNNDQTESRVTVLREDGDRLEEAGVVAGLGKGERIFAVRFIGDQGYVVTFRQVDPLYVLDLRDPAAPKVAGELKVPGFSSYIHPLEPGFLLTAGRDADEEGRVGGIKVEIFDVTDPTSPKSVQSAVIGDGWNTWSDVLWDHKAFSFFRARNLLAIPVSGWVETQTGHGEWWGEYRSELALFRVTREAIEALPSISHMGFFDDFGGNDHCRSYSGYWQAQIYRGVFIEDYVYSLSQLGLQVHDTRDLSAGPVAELTLLDPAAFPPYDWGWCEEQKPEEPTDPEEPQDPPPEEGDGSTPSSR